MRSPAALTATLCLLLTACVDNSGGDGPPGVDVSIEAPGWDPAPAACFGEEGAWLLQDEASVDAFLADCFDEVEVDDKRQAILDVVAGLDASRKLVGARLVMGGCVREYSFMGMNLDGTTLRPWVLKHDTSYGRASAACTDDLLVAEDYWIGEGGEVGSATDAELHVGTFNPELPGSPALPG